MIRKRGVVLVGLLVGFFLLVASWPAWGSQAVVSGSVITGNSVAESISNFYEMSSFGKRIFILLQIVLLIVIVVAIFLVMGKFRKGKKVEKLGYVISKNLRSSTDLDVLYEMLKRNRIIKMEDIEKTFGIGSEVALGWCKILEGGNLGELEYPRFGKPVLRAVDKVKKKAKEIQVITNQTHAIISQN